MTLIIHDARVVTGKPGASAIDCATVVIDDGVITSVTPACAQGGAPDATIRENNQVINAQGRVLMPAFVDAHTHACWAGDRLDEWEAKCRAARAGAGAGDYLRILKSGGGIMATVRAVRQATQEELTASLQQRLHNMLHQGATTIEIKSGYGLTTRDECKMLRAIADAAREFPGTVVPTALLGHAVDPDQPDFFDRTINETLPAVSTEFPSVAIDAYCEDGAWPVEQCERLFRKAIELGHPVRVHADQFHALGMTQLAIDLGARSIDHLEATPLEPLQALARSSAFGVMLPVSGFHLDDRYANGRAFLDAGGKLVIATNCNPGSAPTTSMPFVIALAARKLGLAASEAIAACTSQAAALLNMPDRGVLAPGKRADVILLEHTDERRLAHTLGGDPVDVVVCSGQVVKDRDAA